MKWNHKYLVDAMIYEKGVLGKLDSSDCCCQVEHNVTLPVKVEGFTI